MSDYRFLSPVLNRNEGLGVFFRWRATPANEKTHLFSALAALLPSITPFAHKAKRIHEDQPVAQIATILNLSVSAVKMRLSRARELFHRAYTREEAV